MSIAWEIALKNSLLNWIPFDYLQFYSRYGLLDKRVIKSLAVKRPKKSSKEFAYENLKQK